MNLRHMSFKEALAKAKKASGLRSNEEIANRCGYDLSSVTRYFQVTDAYCPSPEKIPGLCRALGNTILVDWFNAQIEDMRTVSPIVTVQDLSMAVMRATANTGALNSKTLEAVADGNISINEARGLQAQFRKNGDWNYQAADALEPLAGCTP